MADPRVYDTSVAVEAEEAARTLRRLLDDVPEAKIPFAETYGSPSLSGSPTTLLEAAANDRAVREAHGLDILVGALVRVVDRQQRRIEELESAAKPKAGARK